MMFKIQSISDLITNSSSECFIMYTREGVQLFKDLVSKIIGQDFDNLFKIEWTLSEYVEDDFADDNRGYDNIIDFAIAHDEDSYEGSPYILGFEVIAKNPENKEKAGALSAIYDIFEMEERYC